GLEGGGGGAEAADRLGVAAGRDGHPVLGRADVDAGGVVVQDDEGRGGGLLVAAGATAGSSVGHGGPSKGRAPGRGGGRVEACCQAGSGGTCHQGRQRTPPRPNSQTGNKPHGDHGQHDPRRPTPHHTNSPQVSCRRHAALRHANLATLSAACYSVVWFSARQPRSGRAGRLVGEWHPSGTGVVVVSVIVRGGNQ